MARKEMTVMIGPLNMHKRNRRHLVTSGEITLVTASHAIVYLEHAYENDGIGLYFQSRFIFDFL